MWRGEERTGRGKEEITGQRFASQQNNTAMRSESREYNRIDLFPIFISIDTCNNKLENIFHPKINRIN